MTDQSARLALPLIEPGQAQKEIWHNEALTLLDLAVQASVVAVGVDVPPAGPTDGACWIVGDAPTDAWAGQARALAGWTAGGWRFVAPRDGFAAWSVADQACARFRDGAWSLGAAIADPSGGATIDGEARGALTAILAALRAQGLISDG